MTEALHPLFASDAASHGLGIELVAAGPGTATMRMQVTAAMVNGHGAVHGGYVFLLADAAFAYACNRPGGPVTVASGADITFTAPAHIGDVLVAEAAERTRFGRSGLYDVTVYRSDGDARTVVAEFRGRSRER